VDGAGKSPERPVHLPGQKLRGAGPYISVVSALLMARIEGLLIVESLELCLYRVQTEKGVVCLDNGLS
jgi:hypothetical protein